MWRGPPLTTKASEAPGRRSLALPAEAAPASLGRHSATPAKCVSGVAIPATPQAESSASSVIAFRHARMTEEAMRLRGSHELLTKGVNPPCRGVSGAGS